MLTRNRMQHLVRRTHPPGDQETAPRGQDQRHPHGLFPLRLDQGDGSRGTGNHSPPSHTQHMVLSQRKYSIYSIMKCLIDGFSPAYLPPDQLDTQSLAYSPSSLRFWRGVRVSVICLFKWQIYLAGSASCKFFIALSMRHISILLLALSLPATVVHPQEIPPLIPLLYSPDTCSVKSHQIKTPVNPQNAMTPDSDHHTPIPDPNPLNPPNTSRIHQLIHMRPLQPLPPLRPLLQQNSKHLHRRIQPQPLRPLPALHPRNPNARLAPVSNLTHPHTEPETNLPRTAN